MTVTPNGKRVGRPPAEHCKKGHAYTPENTMIIASGKYKGERRCKACRKATKQKQTERERQRSAQRKDSWFF